MQVFSHTRVVLDEILKILLFQVITLFSMLLASRVTGNHQTETYL